MTTDDDQMIKFFTHVTVDEVTLTFVLTREGDQYESNDSPTELDPAELANLVLRAERMMAIERAKTRTVLPRTGLPS